MAPTQSRYVDVESLPWVQQGPGTKCLYKEDDRREGLYLCGAEPGAQIPEHIHAGCELTFFLEGTAQRIATGALFPSYDDSRAGAAE